VVTAAHCLGADAPPVAVQFSTGPDAGESIDATESIAHPEYDAQTQANDIALVRLVRPAATVPALRATLPAAPWVGAPIRIVGSGLDGTSNATQKRSGATVIAEVHDRDFVFHPSPSQTCAGDSGGAAFMSVGGREMLVGVTSAGDPACNVFGVDMRVDAYASFIDAHERAASSDGNGGCAVVQSRRPGETLVLVVVAAAALVYRKPRRAAATTPRRSSPWSVRNTRAPGIVRPG
jgi:secreted trypsin-like serine protease